MFEKCGSKLLIWIGSINRTEIALDEQINSWFANKRSIDRSLSGKFEVQVWNTFDTSSAYDSHKPGLILTHLTDLLESFRIEAAQRFADCIRECFRYELPFCRTCRVLPCETRNIGFLHTLHFLKKTSFFKFTIAKHSVSITHNTLSGGSEKSAAIIQSVHVGC